jgi:hypothetical protein
MRSHVSRKLIGLNASLKPFKVKAMAAKITFLGQSSYLPPLNASSLSGSCMGNLRPLLQLFSKAA